MNTHQLDALADIYGWLIEFAKNKEAEADATGQSETSATAAEQTDTMPAHDHHTPRPGARQTEARR